MNEVKLETPVQGIVWKVLLKVGQKVEAGGTVLIVESMKMEIPIESSSSGTVLELLAAEGDQVQQDSVVAILSAK